MCQGQGFPGLLLACARDTGIPFSRCCLFQGRRAMWTSELQVPGNRGFWSSWLHVPGPQGTQAIAACYKDAEEGGPLVACSGKRGFLDPVACAKASRIPGAIAACARDCRECAPQVACAKSRGVRDPWLHVPETQEYASKPLLHVQGRIVAGPRVACARYTRVSGTPCCMCQRHRVPGTIAACAQGRREGDT